MKCAIVVPTIREKCIQEFLDAWEPEFKDQTLIVCEDNPERSFSLPNWVYQHVAWKDIDADLKDDAWIIPRRSAGIRNYGNLLASRIKGLDMIVNLDDDCLPSELPFLGRHWMCLEETGRALPLFDTMHALCLGKEYPEIRPRGFPKKIAETRTMLNHGLWNGVPDIDGVTQLRSGPMQVSFAAQSNQVPPGTLFPMSAMNIAFRPELLPAMYNLPMGEGQPFHRFDDIWCGLIVKKAADAMGWAVRSGSPCIRHVRASDAKRNAELEAPGIIENDKVWAQIAEMSIAPGTLDAVLEEIYQYLESRGDYWDEAALAARAWRSYVEKGAE